MEEKYMNRVWAVLSIGAFALMACGDSTSASDSSENRYVIGSVMAYEFTDEYLVQTEGKCVEENGKLVWSKDGKQYQSVASLNKSTDSLRVVYKNGLTRYAYEGDDFPIGLFRSAESGMGIIFKKDGILQHIQFYKNECLLDELNMTINPGDKRTGCNTIMKENGTEMKVLPPEGSVFKYVYSGGGVTCNVEARNLFSYYEQDCKDAYEMYLKDTSSTKKFLFENYKVKSTLDSSCFKDLALELYSLQHKQN